MEELLREQFSWLSGLWGKRQSTQHLSRLDEGCQVDPLGSTRHLLDGQEGSPHTHYMRLLGCTRYDHGKETPKQLGSE